MNSKTYTKFIIQENRLERLVKNYVDKYGLPKTSEMMGLSLSKIIQIAKVPIDSEVAFEILREKFIQKELKDTYKNFIISLDRMDGIFYWETTTRTDRYPEDRVQQITVMATPFWDGSKFTPIEISWFTLLNDDMNIIYELEGDGSFYKAFKHQSNFDSVEELLNWYEETYLPGVYDIIMNTLLPKVYKLIDYEMK